MLMSFSSSQCCLKVAHQGMLSFKIKTKGILWFFLPHCPTVWTLYFFYLSSFLRDKLFNPNIFFQRHHAQHVNKKIKQKTNKIKFAWNSIETKQKQKEFIQCFYSRWGQRNKEEDARWWGCIRPISVAISRSSCQFSLTLVWHWRVAGRGGWGVCGCRPLAPCRWRFSR